MRAACGGGRRATRLRARVASRPAPPPVLRPCHHRARTRVPPASHARYRSSPRVPDVSCRGRRAAARVAGSRPFHPDYLLLVAEQRRHPLNVSQFGSATGYGDPRHDPISAGPGILAASLRTSPPPFTSLAAAVSCTDGGWSLRLPSWNVGFRGGTRRSPGQPCPPRVSSRCRSPARRPCSHVPSSRLTRRASAAPPRQAPPGHRRNRFPDPYTHPLH